MMRLVMMGLGVFLLSLGGTTGALVMKARKAHPIVADSTTAPPDSVAVDSARSAPDSAARIAQADSSKADSAAHGGPKGHSEDTATSVLGARLSQDPVATPPAAASGGETARQNAAYKQLARIFSNMKTTDAAKVLAYMSDEEVQGVLQQLGVRPAAGLLAALPKERAAVLSRRMLNDGGKKDSMP